MELSVNVALVMAFGDKLAPEVLCGILKLLALPHGCQFCDLMLTPSEGLWINMDELVDYYYQWRWPAC